MRGRQLGIPDSWWLILLDGEVRELHLDRVGLSDFDFDAVLQATRRAAIAHSRRIVTRSFRDQRMIAVQAFGPGTKTLGPEPSMFSRHSPLPESVDRQPMPTIASMLPALTVINAGTVPGRTARFMTVDTTTRAPLPASTQRVLDEADALRAAREQERLEKEAAERVEEAEFRALLASRCDCGVGTGDQPHASTCPAWWLNSGPKYK